MKYTESCGNVFKDLGCKDAEILLLKSQLSCEIKKLIELKNYTQMDVSDITGVTQPNVSRITNGHLRHFTIDRLIRILLKLRADIFIVVSEKSYES
jgi:predicted XRE-type DNA-binding protein